MAGEQKYTVDVGVTGLQQLDRLGQSLDVLSKRMLTLRGAIAGLGLAALGRSALLLADDMQDLSNSTGIAVGRLVEFRNALAVSGGDATQMSTGINTFARSIDEAAQGSLKAQNRFRELGITLEDLRTLSEEQLMMRTLEGLAGVENASRRAALQMDFFGKSFKTVNPREMADQLREAAGSGDAFAASIKRAAELNDQLTTASGNLRLAILEAFGPLIAIVAGFNNEMGKSKQSMETLITVIKALGIALAVAFAFTGWTLVVRAIGVIGRGVGALTGLFSGLGKTISTTFGANSTVMKVLRGVGGLLVGIATAVGLISATSQEATSAGDAATAAGDEVEKTKATIERPIDTTALENARKSIAKMGEDFAKTNEQIIEQIRLDTSLIGKSREFQEIERARAENTKRTADQVARLTDARNKLSKEERDAGLALDYDKQIEDAKRLGAATEERLVKEIQLKSQAEALDQLRQFRIKSEIDNQNQLKDIQDELAKLTLPTIEQKYYDIEAAAKRAAAAAIQAEEARIGRPLDAGERQRFMDIAMQGTERLKQAQGELYDQSRTFETGWRQAFNAYAEAATNSAQQAKDIFGQVTKGMEDMIVNFTKTGKLNFREFLANIAEMILRSQIQRLFAQMFSGTAGGAGGGGIFSSIGNFFSSLFAGFFADGGMIPAGKFGVVGEAGPELVSGPAQITPMAAAGGGTYITYNINAVDTQSFQQALARDPEFLFAVTEKGRRSLPSSRR